MAKPILGLDIDSTIWDAARWYIDACREMGFGHPGRQHVTEWYWYEKHLGLENMIKMFNYALDPARLYDRPVYPGVSEAIEQIKDLGIDIHVITHNAQPDVMRAKLKPWLYDLFGEVGLSVYHFNTPKMRKLKELDAFGMIDDRADFIIDCAKEGLWAAAKLHPHNYIELAKTDQKVFVFETWDEVVPELQTEAFLRFFDKGRSIA